MDSDIDIVGHPREAPYPIGRGSEKSWHGTSLVCPAIFNLSFTHFSSVSQTSPRPFISTRIPLHSHLLNTVIMVKLQEVEDEHFQHEKPAPSKDNVLLASDDEDDYTDTG